MRNVSLRPRQPPPQPFEIVNGDGVASLLLICDHASNRIPRRLAGLGLKRRHRTRHIAWDIGAGAVCRALAERFGAPAILCGTSRLVIDCNRRPGSPGSILEVSDGVPIPGNQGLDAAVLAEREATWFTPYHDALGALLAQCDRHGRHAGLISIHSFTPAMNGVARPWPVGVLWTHDPRLAEPLMAALRRRGIAVGDNQPYSGRDPNGGYSIQRHGAAQSRPHVAIELRQDEVGDEAGVTRWSEILAAALIPILREQELLPAPNLPLDHNHA